MKTLSQNILNLRKANNLTQKNLADMMQVTFQTISKWENDHACPDISLLPKLADVFKVSVDQLLGVLPLNESNYSKRRKTDNLYRTEAIDQYTADRLLYWNNDYLEFLVKQVWQLNHPVKIAEINCGNGILASQIMPHLHEDSTYTGFDKNTDMIENPYKTVQSMSNVNLLSNDSLKKYLEHFDVVICQGYLRHLSNPSDGIETMKKILKPNGLLICHEENRPFENTGLLLGNLSDSSFEKGIFLEKLWQTEMIKEGRDYRVGLRLPIILKEAKLKNIECRMNDKMNLVLSKEDEKTLNLINEHFRLTSITEKELLNFLFERGLNRYEASRYIELYHERVNYMNQDINNIQLVHQIGLVISWGHK